MLGVLVQMAALIACGVVWRLLRPGGLDADETRRALTGLVYYLLLPALVLEVLWRTPLGLGSVRIAVSAASGVLVALALAWLACRLCAMPRPVSGAAMLAAAFPNVTYLGLPVLDKVLGPWSRGVAIQYDLFACTPLLLTVGIVVARRFGTRPGTGHTWTGLLRVPPLWAALAALALNRAGVPLGTWPAGLLNMLGNGVVPLMLLSLGMSLRWEREGRRKLRSLVPALFIQLLLTPVVVWAVARGVGVEGRMLTAVVLEGAMPTMVLGLVIADRYGLDSGLYAVAVTLSTALSLFTLPLWFRLLGATA